MMLVHVHIKSHDDLFLVIHMFVCASVFIFPETKEGNRAGAGLNVSTSFI